MRGALLGAITTSGEVRITPAYAGSTQHKFGYVCQHGDHPRVCGEHGPLMTGSTQSEGSPPRMRGALHEIGIIAGSGGITPAYAGSTTTKE